MDFRPNRFPSLWPLRGLLTRLRDWWALRQWKVRMTLGELQRRQREQIFYRAVYAPNDVNQVENLKVTVSTKIRNGS